jgi:hypothetical protein
MRKETNLFKYSPTEMSATFGAVFHIQINAVENSFYCGLDNCKKCNN